DKLAIEWAAQPTMDAASISRIVTTEYLKQFQDPANASEVTMSAFDLSKSDELAQSVAALGNSLTHLSTDDAKAVFGISGTAQAFDGDYIDLGDLVTQLKNGRIGSVPTETLVNVQTALSHYVIDSKATTGLAKATGATIWLPQSTSTMQAYVDK